MKIQLDRVTNGWIARRTKFDVIKTETGERRDVTDVFVFPNSELLLKAFKLWITEEGYGSE